MNDAKSVVDWQSLDKYKFVVSVKCNGWVHLTCMDLDYTY